MLVSYITNAPGKRVGNSVKRKSSLHCFDYRKMKKTFGPQGPIVERTGVASAVHIFGRFPILTCFDYLAGASLVASMQSSIRSSVDSFVTSDVR